MVFTSGTTGHPKAVVLTARGLGASGRPRRDLRCGRRFEGPARRRTRVRHGAAQMLLAGMSGARLVVAPGSAYGGPELTELIAAERVTHACLTPSVASSVAAGSFPNLATLMLAASGSPTMCRHGGVRGAGSSSGTARPRRRHSRRGRVHWPVRPTADRRPARGIDAVVLDRRLQPVPPGVTGELYLAGDRLAAGYDGDGARTAERFVAAPVAAACTGPETSCGGSRHGRCDARLPRTERRPGQDSRSACRTRRGRRRTRSLPGVRSAVTVPREHGDGHALYSYVVPESCDPARVRAALVDRLPAPMIPTAILTTDSIPLTANGKVDAGRLPKPVRERSGAPTNPPRPWSRRRTPRRSGPTWTVWTTSSSSEADSLLATAVVSQLRHGSDASSRCVCCSTSRPSRPRCRDRGWPVRGSRRGPVAGNRPERLPLSRAQQRMWTRVGPVASNGIGWGRGWNCAVRWFRTPCTPH
ncbi:AMP-binding protein [Rhodococcus hoagii]|nr:AMP-binding protein [Prescottella equi]